MLDAIIISIMGISITLLTISCAKDVIKHISKKQPQRSRIDWPERKLSETTEFQQRAPEYNYKAKKCLFTVAELHFLKHLKDAIGEEFNIHGKVRVADLIYSSKTDQKQQFIAFRKTTQKHLDFVICPKDDSSILCAVELDDKSHSKKDRIERDNFINNAFAEAGIKLHRIQCRASYDIQSLREQILGFNAEKNKESTNSDNTLNSDKDAKYRPPGYSKIGWEKPIDPN